MKDFSKRFGFIAFAAVIALALAGCGPTVESVSVNAAGGADSIKAGDTLKFNVTVTGKNNPSQNVKWSVSSKSDGSGAVADGTDISPGGILSVDAKETATTLYVKAVSAQSADKFDYKPVKIEAVKAAATTTTTTAAKPAATVTEITITPENLRFRRQGGQFTNLTAKVTGTNNPAQTVTWKVARNEDGKGEVDKNTKIDATGKLSVDGEKENFYVIATSTVDNKKSKAVKVTIGGGGGGPGDGGGTTGGGTTGGGGGANNQDANAGGGGTPTVTKVIVSPAGTVEMEKGKSQKFTVSVEGTNNPGAQGVTWSVSRIGQGALSSETKIDESGTLTIAANEVATDIRVRARAVADNTKSDTAIIKVK